MTRHTARIAALLALTAFLPLVALAADDNVPAAPATEKLLAEAIKLVGPAKDVPKELILKEGDTVVCLGDSITQGGGYLKDMDCFFSQQCGDLKIKKVINAGISGHKAENMLARFEKDVVARKPAVVTINVGINDVWHRVNKPHDPNVLATYKENVGKMIDLAQAAEIKVVLLAPSVIYEDLASEGNKRLPLYVGAMKELAAAKKCGFVDLHQMCLDALKQKPADMKDNWLTGDGVHMKPLGYAVMAVAALRGLGASDEKIAATETPAPQPKPAAKKMAAATPQAILPAN